MDAKSHGYESSKITRFSNDISIFPNPSEGDLLINFGTTHIWTFNIEYIDVTGRIAEEEINIDDFTLINDRWELNMDDMQEDLALFGIYLDGSYQYYTVN